MKQIFILVILCPFLYQCKPITVRGRVINEEGSPISGAIITVQRIMVLETPIPDIEPAVLSDKDGSFIIPNRLPNDTLVITATGYEPAHKMFNLRGFVIVILKRKSTL